MRVSESTIEVTITEAEALAHANVHHLMQLLVEESTHTAAYELAKLLETDELRELAHACDLGMVPRDRDDLALAVVVAGRGADEDEEAALLFWRMKQLQQQRMRAAALN